MGIQALLGRVITPQDDQPAAPFVCLLSRGFWKSRFALSPEVLGKTITLKRIPFTVVGVAPEFGREPAADILVPMVTNLQPLLKHDHTFPLHILFNPSLS